MNNGITLERGGCTVEQHTVVLKALHNDTAAATALCHVFSTNERTEEVAHGLNTVFMVLSGALVFIMHGGFAMLEAGAIRSKNAMNILLQTVLDGAASAIMWYLVGFGFAYGIGEKPNGFIGDALFGLARYESHETVVGTGDWTSWFFQWAFCATAATIPAGAVAERFNFNAYLGYSLFLGGFVYPVIVHWVWCRTGWLGYGVDNPLRGIGMIDFAGSGVVHMTGGLAGLIGAWMVGPRMGRFDSNGQPVHMPGHSAILVVLGTVLLWFGWYGFNPGSALVADTRSSAIIAGRAAVTTTLSGAAGGMACLALSVVRNQSWDLTSLCNGMLVGFVAITAGCTVVEPWAALLCGGVAGALFEGACWALLKLRIDDVVSAGPMHGCCGAWGVIFVGLLAKEDYVRQTFNRKFYPYGLFYGGGGELLLSQFVGLVSIAGWVAGTMGPFFWVFKKAKYLRISAEDEAMGLDASKHGGSAYNIPMNRYGGGFGDSNLFEMSHAGFHMPVTYTNGGGGGGGGAAGRAIGDAIMRAATYGGLFSTGGGGAGGGGAGGGLTTSNNSSSMAAIVAPFDGLNGVVASHASPAAGNYRAPVGPESSTSSDAAPLFRPSSNVRQEASPPCTASVRDTDAGLQPMAAATAGKEITSLGSVATAGGGGYSKEGTAHSHSNGSVRAVNGNSNGGSATDASARRKTGTPAGAAAGEVTSPGAAAPGRGSDGAYAVNEVNETGVFNVDVRG